MNQEGIQVEAFKVRNLPSPPEQGETLIDRRRGSVEEEDSGGASLATFLTLEGISDDEELSVLVDS